MQKNLPDAHQPRSLFRNGKLTWKRLLPAMSLIALIALLLGFRIMTVVQSACLNGAFLSVIGSWQESSKGQVQQALGCLSDGSPLLTGERGKLRLVQMALTFSDPQSAASVLADQPPKTFPGRLAYLLLGSAYLADGDADAAILSWRRAEALTDLIHAGRDAFATGDISQALKFWQPARAIWQDKGLHSKEETEAAESALSSMAGIWTREYEYQRAADATAELSQILGPAYPATMVSAGLLYLQANNLEEAKRWFETVLTQSPDNSRACYGLGQVFAARQQWEQAVPYFQQAVEHEPGYYEGWYWLGQGYLRIGRQPDACQALREALRLAPPRTFAEQELIAAGCEPE